MSDPTGIPGGEASDLEWFFGQGGALFERSPSGAIMERLLRDSDASQPCRVCAGRGILCNRAAVRRHIAAKRPTESVERSTARRARGVWETTTYEKSVPVDVGSWCQLCGGTGSVPKRRPRGSEMRAIYVGSRCRLVGGLDARPGSPQQGGAARSEPDTAALVRFAITSRRLSRLADQHRAVLLAYHGDVGARWGRAQPGRIFALYPLTRGGRSLLGRGRGVEGGGGVGGAAERLWSTVAAHLSQPHHRTHLALERANEQARELLGAAYAAWAGTDPRAAPAAFLDDLTHRYPPPPSAWERLIAEVESWDPEAWAGAPARGHDGVWR